MRWWAEVVRSFPLAVAVVLTVVLAGPAFAAGTDRATLKLDGLTLAYDPAHWIALPAKDGSRATFLHQGDGGGRDRGYSVVVDVDDERAAPADDDQLEARALCPAAGAASAALVDGATDSRSQRDDISLGGVAATLTVFESPCRNLAAPTVLVCARHNGRVIALWSRRQGCRWFDNRKGIVELATGARLN